jgi:YVTN family beta-propeller protein
MKIVLKSPEKGGKKNRRLNMGKKVFLMGLLFLLLVVPVYAEDMVYVSNAGDKSLSLVSTGTDQIVATISIGTKGSWPSNQWNTKYFAFNTKKGVDIVSVTGDVVSSLNLKSKKNWQDFTPDGKLLVTSSRDVDISYFIDMNEASDNFGKVIAKVQWPKKFGICDMTISPDGKYGYVPGIFSDKFGVLDLQNKKILKIIDIPRINKDSAVKPFMSTVTWDGKYVFVENEELGKGKGTESVIDVTDPANPKEIVRFVPEDSLAAAKAALEPKGVAVKKMLGREPQSDEISLDNKYAFLIMRATKSVGVVDIDTMEMIKEIPLTAGGKPRTGDLSPDGSKLYVSSPETNSVDVVDVATLKKVKTIKGFKKPQGVIGVKLSAGHAVEELSAVKKNLAETEKELHALEANLKEVKSTAEAAKAEGKGICGPTALIALAMLPLGAYRLYRRRK